MLTYSRGPLDQAADSSGRPDTVGAAAAKAHLATIKRFCICALIVLAAGGVLAAIIALKATIYLSRLNY
jgi:hypothetical protein